MAAGAEVVIHPAPVNSLPFGALQVQGLGQPVERDAPLEGPLAPLAHRVVDGARAVTRETQPDGRLHAVDNGALVKE